VVNLNNGYIYTAIDSGATWTRQTASGQHTRFIYTVINTKGTVFLEGRVNLENAIRQVHNAVPFRLWDVFADSKDGKQAQVNAVKLMSMLGSKML
jgi:hypothetical protein